MDKFYVQKRKINFLGKFFFYTSLFFIPLFLYRWRLFNLFSFSISDLFIFLSFILSIRRLKFDKLILPLLLIIFLILFETCVFVFKNGFIYFQTTIWLYVFAKWVLYFFVFMQYINNYDDIIFSFRIIAYSSVWILYGSILHVYELLTRHLFTTIPFIEFFHAALPSRENTLLYATSVSTDNGIRRFCFPFSYSSSGAGISAAVITLITLLFYLKYKRKPILLFFIVIDFFYVFMTLSRSAWLVLFAGVFFLLLDRMRNFRFKTKSFILLIIVFLVLFFLIFLPTDILNLFNIVVQIIKNRLDGSYYARLSTEGHIETMRYAFHLFSLSPIFGFGLGGYRYSRFINFSQSMGGAHPHDNYLLFLSEGGIIGFLIYFFILFFPTIYFFLYINHIKKDFKLFVLYKNILFIQISVSLSFITYAYFANYSIYLIFIFWKIFFIAYDKDY